MFEEILVGIAVAAGGASVVAVVTAVVKSYRLVADMSKSLRALLSINDVQSNNIIVLKRAWVEIIQALRSHSYALREIGANGSTTKALDHVGNAETIMRSCDDANAAAAMRPAEKGVP